MKYFGMFLVIMAAMGCGKKEEKKGKAKAELASVGSPVLTSSVLGINLTNSSMNANMDVTVETLKMPVAKLYLMNSEGSGEIYSCPSSTPSECMVDLTGGTLVNLLPQNSEKELPVGTYETINIYYTDNCQSRSDYTIKFKASGKLQGQTYYTKANGKLSTTGPSEEIEVVYGASCKPSTLPTPVEITENGSVTVRSFFDIQNLADIETGRPGSCIAEDKTSTVKLCIQPPDIAATVDASNPTIERYIITDGALASKGCLGMAGLFINSSNKPFGGYLRPSFFEGQDCKGSLGGGGSLSVSENADNSVKMYDAPAANPELGWNIYNAFQRSSHSGTMSAKIGSEFSSKNYTAQKL